MTDEEAMELALAEAARAVAHGDVPVGAVLLRGDEVLSSRHNERELRGDPTAHAEMLVIRDASALLSSAELTQCTMAVTLEPCAMCAGAPRRWRDWRTRLRRGRSQGGGVRHALCPRSPIRRSGPSAEVVGGVESVRSPRRCSVSFFAELRATRRRSEG